jgi:uncharacterized glyoxalase superfamily protein PhnB
LVATVAAGGRDVGGTSFIRVTPAWFGGWCRDRDELPRAVRETARLAVAIHYERPPRAARWLRDAFGLQPMLEPADNDDADDWIELRAGTGVIVLLRQEAPATADAQTHVPWVFVDNLDAHLDQARAAGATIVRGIEQHGYRAYQAEDLEGHRWTFAQARPTMVVKVT